MKVRSPINIHAKSQVDWFKHAHNGNLEAICLAKRLEAEGLMYLKLFLFFRSEKSKKQCKQNSFCTTCWEQIKENQSLTASVDDVQILVYFRTKITKQNRIGMDFTLFPLVTTCS